MLQALDEAPLTRRFYILAGAVMLGAVLDLFDFFLIGFVVLEIADEWDLTFGEQAIVLLAAGVGAILGAIAYGGWQWLQSRKEQQSWKSPTGGDGSTYSSGMYGTVSGSAGASGAGSSPTGSSTPEPASAKS